jgi:hypothetical protein
MWASAPKTKSERMPFLLNTYPINWRVNCSVAFQLPMRTKVDWVYSIIPPEKMCKFSPALHKSLSGANAYQKGNTHGR